MKPGASFTMPMASWQQITQRVTALEERLAKFERIGWIALGLLLGSGAVNVAALLKALGE